MEEKEVDEEEKSTYQMSSNGGAGASTILMNSGESLYESLN